MLSLAQGRSTALRMALSIPPHRLCRIWILHLLASTKMCNRSAVPSPNLHKLPSLAWILRLGKEETVIHKIWHFSTKRIGAKPRSSSYKRPQRDKDSHCFRIASWARLDKAPSLRSARLRARAWARVSSRGANSGRAQNTNQSTIIKLILRLGTLGTAPQPPWS